MVINFKNDSLNDKIKQYLHRWVTFSLAELHPSAAVEAAVAPWPPQAPPTIPWLRDEAQLRAEALETDTHLSPAQMTFCTRSWRTVAVGTCTLVGDLTPKILTLILQNM